MVYVHLKTLFNTSCDSFQLFYSLYSTTFSSLFTLFSLIVSCLLLLFWNFTKTFVCDSWSCDIIIYRFYIELCIDILTLSFPFYLNWLDPFWIMVKTIPIITHGKGLNKERLERINCTFQSVQVSFLEKSFFFFFLK